MRTDTARLNAAFEEAAFAPERWNEVLAEAGEAFDASLFALLRLHREGGELIGPPEKAGPHLERYRAGEWWRYDLRALRLHSAAPMKIFADDDLLGPGERESSKFYRGFAEEADAYYSLAWSFFVDDRVYAFSAVWPKDHHPPGPSDRLALAEIRAKATHAAIVSAHLEEAREHGLIASLEAAGMAALALDRDGRVVNATRAGATLLSAHFTLENGSLALPDSSSSASAAALATLKADLKSDALGSGQGAFAIERPGMASILCTPLHHRTPTHQALSEVRALLILKDLAAPTPVPADVLSHLYGLTAAEADVARHIAAGHSVEDISRTRGVAEATTRTILRAVFRKTGASRQGELAAMLNRLG